MTIQHTFKKTLCTKIDTLLAKLDAHCAHDDREVSRDIDFCCHDQIRASHLSTQTPVDTYDLMDDSALISAAGSGDLQHVYTLLYRKGINPNVKSASGTTALIQATLNGCENLGIIELLLARGADVNAATADGLTALMIAVMKGYHTVVDLLLNAGADIHMRDIFAYNARDLAEWFSHTAIADMLSKASEIRVVQVPAEYMPPHIVMYAQAYA